MLSRSEDSAKLGVLRLGVIGCGRVLERCHLPALRRSTTWAVTAACDPQSERRAWAKAALPGAVLFQSAPELLRNTDLDAALIVSPASVQAELTIACLRLGLHVLVEKPGGSSLEEALSMQRAAREADRLLRIGFNRRFKPAYQVLRKALHGEQIESIRSHFAFSLRAWDPIDGLDPARLNEALVLYDVAVHQLDLIPWLAGKAIQTLRVESIEGTAGAGSAQFSLLLEGQLLARCQAAHAEIYREDLEVDAPKGRWIAHPSGLLRSNRLGLRTLRRVAAAQYWVQRKLMRLGLMADPLAASYGLQLESFARQIRGSESGSDMAYSEAPVPVYAALQALIQGARSPGEWIAVSATGPDHRLQAAKTTGAFDQSAPR